MLDTPQNLWYNFWRTKSNTFVFNFFWKQRYSYLIFFENKSTNRFKRLVLLFSILKSLENKSIQLSVKHKITIIF
jgi:hypothetical protein